MAIRELMGSADPTMFIDEYFLRLPYSRPGDAAHLCPLGQWPNVKQLISNDEADLLIVREGRRWEESHHPSGDEAMRLFNDGYTLLIRHAERHDASLQSLAQSFAIDFHAAVDVHLYCTPAAQYGFGWHYDAEDVFIIQAGGVKEYSLRKNTVNPWPVTEAIPENMRYERELMPLIKCKLAPGDWLYIPHGYWHMGQAEEDAVSLAVGLMMPTALDLIDFLRRDLPQSIRWRQRLPVTGSAAISSSDDSEQQFAEIISGLAADIGKAMQEPTLISRFLESLKK